MSSDLSRRVFPHRANSNGTSDSICPRCYATVGTSVWEAELEFLEALHICEKRQLNFFEGLRRGSMPVVSADMPYTGVTRYMA